MDNPDFTLLRTGIDGFKPEQVRKDGFQKISAINVLNFADWLRFSRPDMELNDIHDWHDLVRATYERIGFFRKYYCGEDLPNVIYKGGLGIQTLGKGNRLGEKNKWHLMADELNAYGDAEKERLGE